MTQQDESNMNLVLSIDSASLCFNSHIETNTTE